MNKPHIIGIPKSGNNVAEKAVRLLGEDCYAHRHTANHHIANIEPVIYVYRNPRNVLISALRFRNHQRRGHMHDLSQDALIDCFYDFFNCSLNHVYLAYMPWLESSACKVRFEDLIDGRVGVDQIACYLGVPRMDDTKLSMLYGSSPTWSGKLSDWHEVWGDDIDAVWRAEGMLDIERKLGY